MINKRRDDHFANTRLEFRALNEDVTCFRRVLRPPFLCSLLAAIFMLFFFLLVLRLNFFLSFLFLFLSFFVLSLLFSFFFLSFFLSLTAAKRRVRRRSGWARSFFSKAFSAPAWTRPRADDDEPAGAAAAAAAAAAVNFDLDLPGDQPAAPQPELVLQPNEAISLDLGQLRVMVCHHSLFESLCYFYLVDISTQYVSAK